MHTRAMRAGSALPACANVVELRAAWRMPACRNELQTTQDTDASATQDTDALQHEPQQCHIDVVGCQPRTEMRFTTPCTLSVCVTIDERVIVSVGD